MDQPSERHTNLSLKYKVAAHKTRRRFEFYFVGLTFTLLALALKSATFKVPLGGKMAELGGWLALLLSGMVGLYILSQLRHLPSLASKVADAAAMRDKVRAARDKKNAPYVGITLGSAPRKNVPIAQAVEDANMIVEDGNERWRKKRDSLRYWSWLQRGLFVLGLCSLFASRAWLPFINVVVQLGL